MRRNLCKFKINMRSITNVFFRTLILLSVLAQVNCIGNEDGVISCFPNSAVDVLVDLSLPQFQPLNNVGGYVTTTSALAGTRGLIIVRSGMNNFIAYDRNAPHICPGENTTLEVEDGITIVCPADGAKWILLTGQPIEIAGVAPRRYFCSFNPSSGILRITN